MNCAVSTSPDIGELAGALAAAQAAIENVAKDGANPHFRSRYATLSAVLDEVRPKLAAQGIAIVQMAVNAGEGNIGVVTRLAHKSGQWIESTLYVAPSKFDAQGAGSAVSYLRRYSLMAMAGVGQDDDDGEAAVRQPEPRRQEMRRAGPRYGTASGSPAVGAVVDDPFAPVEPGPAEHPSRQEALDEYARIELAINESRTPSQVDALWKAEGVTGGALELIRHVSPDSYALLLGMAKGRKNELRAAA